MVSAQNIKNIWQIAVWSACTTVLCCLLVFAGNVTESRNAERSGINTELCVSVRNSARRTISYRIPDVKALNQFFGEISTNAGVLHYGRIVATGFKNNIKYWAANSKPEKVVRTTYTRRKYHDFYCSPRG